MKAHKALFSLMIKPYLVYGGVCEWTVDTGPHTKDHTHIDNKHIHEKRDLFFPVHSNFVSKMWFIPV